MKVTSPLGAPIPNFYTKPKRSFTQFFSSILLISNLLSIILSVLFLLDLDRYYLPNVLGVLLLLTLIGNIIVAGVAGERKRYDQFYLVFTIIVMILLPILNTIASVQLSTTSSRSWISISLLIILLVLGVFMTWVKRGARAQTQTMFDHPSPVSFTRERKFNKAVIGTILLGLCLLGGCYVAYILLVGKTGGAVEMFLPGYMLFFSISTLAVVALILKIRRSFLSILLSIIGLVVAICFSVPVIATAFTIEDAEGKFNEAFEVNLDSRIPEQVSKHFLSTPFSLANYFFGTKTNAYIVKEDVLFYEGLDGIDKDIELRFDAYMPPENGADLPGNREVLIRIHGGGWTIGDKGASNNSQINKYFASQGYVVFDVQYGLSSEDKFVESAPVPENIVGDFTIDDMVRHIGLFTDYLVTHNDEFQADLDSVFVSGPSAGGQLASAVGLGLASGDYEDLLNPALQVKGIIPIYPANGLATNVGIGGAEGLVDPTLLVEEESPPALIFQGTADGVVDPSIAKAFDRAYDNNDNPGSALLMMPFAGHNGDFYFSSYYNQIFIYYMERFMYLH
ncbi:alpha/beta hydrolase [Aquibacillus koreensis]|uniref:Alpha/beta hydrolase n=1 Tax=Aquibacillus koreensis TaxID=279446 RepID=A0A9X3WHR9_9BACI|nr:alpha/beta hydrolase [Aquibacillus koreensis]MCT2537057.1 alpha/beta hydrolase [Aquibacillus koreensis]MDC3419960.1 alpha/beta hydrolase [Aquibacillus koreensis]